MSPNDVTGINLQQELVNAGATGPSYGDDFGDSFRRCWATFVDGVEELRSSGDNLVAAFHDLAKFLHPLEANRAAYFSARKGIRASFEAYYETAYGADGAAKARAAVMTKVDSSLQTIRRQRARGSLALPPGVLAVR
jgi:hypothetical protein